MKEKNVRNWVIHLGLVIVVIAALFWVNRSPEKEPEETTLRIGVVMWGHHDEGLWDPAAANAVLRLQEKYNLEITWIEDIVLTDLESVLRSLANKNDVIYLTTDEFEEACKSVAPDYPEVYWIQQYESEAIPQNYYPDNVIVINAYKANELSFLAGAVAAKMTETGKLGIIQAIAGPRDTRIGSAAFRSGAQYVNPSIEVIRVVIGSYVDPMKTRNSVASLAESGCDVILVGMDDESGTLEAKEMGIYTIQTYKDITPDFPDTIIGCTCWVWDVALDRILEAVVEGRYDELRAENHEILLTLEDGSLDIKTFGNMVPDNVKEFTEKLRKKLINGTVTVPDVEEWERGSS